MGSYWEGVVRRWKRMQDQPGVPTTGTGQSGTGPGGTGPGGTGPGGPGNVGQELLGPEWELIYRKFRQFNRRDPYSDQELIDWWNNL